MFSVYIFLFCSENPQKEVTMENKDLVNNKRTSQYFVIYHLFGHNDHSYIWKKKGEYAILRATT